MHSSGVPYSNPVRWTSYESILWMGTLRSEIRNLPRSHDSEAGNWKLNAQKVHRLSSWPPLRVAPSLPPFTLLRRRQESPKGSQGGDQICPSDVKISNFAFTMFCPLCFADSQIWRCCILNDGLTSSVSLLGSGILSEQCLACGSVNICWMNEHLFTNFHTAFGHKVTWYIALGRYFWLIFVGMFK